MKKIILLILTLLGLNCQVFKIHEKSNYAKDLSIDGVNKKIYLQFDFSKLKEPDFKLLKELELKARELRKSNSNLVLLDSIMAPEVSNNFQRKNLIRLILKENSQSSSSGFLSFFTIGLYPMTEFFEYDYDLVHFDETGKRNDLLLESGAFPKAKDTFNFYFLSIFPYIFSKFIYRTEDLSERSEYYKLSSIYYKQKVVELTKSQKIKMEKEFSTDDPFYNSPQITIKATGYTAPRYVSRNTTYSAKTSDKELLLLNATIRNNTKNTIQLAFDKFELVADQPTSTPMKSQLTFDFFPGYFDKRELGPGDYGYYYLLFVVDKGAKINSLVAIDKSGMQVKGRFTKFEKLD